MLDLVDFRSFGFGALIGALLCLAIVSGAIGFGFLTTNGSGFPALGSASSSTLGNAMAGSPGSPASAMAASTADGTTVTPLFSPGSAPQIISLINSAQHSIDIEMYEMTDAQGLGAALAAAQARGVTVRLILEPRVVSKSIPAMVAGLTSAGIQVRWASLQYTLTHSKMMIIDGHVVLVGSINFSKAAQNTNREADAILDGPVASQYENVFAQDWTIASDARPADAGTGAGG